MDTASNFDVTPENNGAVWDIETLDAQLIRNPAQRRAERAWLTAEEFYDLYGRQQHTQGEGLHSHGTRQLRGAALRAARARQESMAGEATQ